MFTKKYEWPFEEGKCTQDKIRVQNIKLGSKLIVQPNQVAYIVVSKKLLDKFPEGTFDLEGGYLVKTYKACRLDKPRKGRVTKKKYYAKNFKGSILFINIQDYKNLPFLSKKILLFDRLDDFRFKIGGRYSFKIVDIDLFAKFIAKYLRGNSYIMSKVNNYVSKRISYEFHKEEYEIEYFLMKESIIFDRIMDKLNKKLSKIGISLYNPILTDFYVNKRNQNKINNYISDGQIKIKYQKLLEGEEYVNLN